MIDREKVIKGLENLSEWLFQQYRVVYDGDAPNYYDAYKTVDEAIELLKEHEAVEPRVSTTEQRCGYCNKVIEMDGWKTCPWCGKMIDWERWWNENGTHDNS